MDQPQRRTIGGYGAVDPPKGEEGLLEPVRHGFDLSLEHGRQYLAVARDPDRSETDRARAALRLGMFPGLVDAVVALACDPTVPGFAGEQVGKAAFSLMRHNMEVAEADFADFAPSARRGALAAMELAHRARNNPPFGFS